MPCHVWFSGRLVWDGIWESDNFALEQGLIYWQRGQGMWEVRGSDPNDPLPPQWKTISP